MLEKNLISKIKSVYEEFTDTEKVIADFFINNKKMDELSAKSIASRIYVSEASLSRFSQKMNFRGYREFIYEYKKQLKLNNFETNCLTRQVLDNYRGLLADVNSLIEDKEILRISELLLESRKTYVYGYENTSDLARDFRLKFMNIGFNIEHIVDKEIMEINGQQLNKENLIIGFSTEDNFNAINKHLRAAREEGAKTVLITSLNKDRLNEYFDELFCIDLKKDSEIGHIISPQIPMLLITELIYVKVLELDPKRKPWI